MLPGWYGTGTALAELGRRRRRPAGPRCSDLHDRWPFFRTVLSNMGMVLAKTDLEHRRAATPTWCPTTTCARRVFDRIAAEHERTAAMVLADHRDDRPAGRQPVAGPQRSATASRTSSRCTTCRSSCCAAGAAGDDDELTERSIQLTINGLATALRNSG